MLNRSFVKILIATFFFTVAFSFVSSFKVSAAFPAGCQGPVGIPTSCPNKCNSASDTNCYLPDFQCSLSGFLSSGGGDCCPNKCNGEAPIKPADTGVFAKLNIFGTQFVFNSSSIPSLINAAISTFLGFVSIYALVRGMYIGAVLRTRATSADDITKVNKEIVNLIIGFILAWSFIFIIQFISSVLGIGNLNDLNVTNTGTEIVIK